MKVYALNTLGSGQDTLDLVARAVPIAGVIGLSERDATDSISDYLYQRSYCDSRSIPLVEVDGYSLSHEKDKAKLLALEIDVLLVLGWQRLIPQWLIDHCSICAIGSHGSPLGITKGRGRSPQNWALILGCETFDISIFEIDPGIDSGRVIDSRQFRYSPYDDIKTSYYKVSLLESQMMVDAITSPNFAERNFTTQPDDEAEHFPQRTPEDGRIDWRRSNVEIARFVRALTKPYPGAHTTIDGHQTTIWSAVPFDVDLKDDCQPGEVFKVFNKNDVLVKTGDGFILIDEYDVDGLVLRDGMRFDSASFEQQIKRIIDRHQQKLPGCPIAKRVLDIEPDEQRK